MMRKLSYLLVAVLVAPIALAQAGLAWIAVGERLGATPFAGLTPRNSAEAAAMGLSADMLRYLRRGEDPHDVHPVRPEIISSAILRATTLEAAIWSRQIEMVKLLDREGAVRDARDRAALACLAADLEVEDVAAYLAPEGGGCRVGEALAQVTVRTSGTAVRP